MARFRRFRSDLDILFFVFVLDGGVAAVAVTVLAVAVAFPTVIPSLACGVMIV